MRQRAEAADSYGGGAWQTAALGYNADRDVLTYPVHCADEHIEIADVWGEEPAEHIASWHPAVALAVADLLEAAAKWTEDTRSEDSHALSVARAYLGRDS